MPQAKMPDTVPHIEDVPGYDEEWPPGQFSYAVLEAGREVRDLVMRTREGDHWETEQFYTPMAAYVRIMELRLQGFKVPKIDIAWLRYHIGRQSP